MDSQAAQAEPAPTWQRTATLVVYALVAAAVLYMVYAFYIQRMYSGLMADLLSGDRPASEAAAEKLCATDRSLPYLGDALINSPDPADRALVAETILRRLKAYDAAAGTDQGERPESRRARLRSGLNLEAVTHALSDESPAVRAAALAIVDRVGTERAYQRNRVDEMKQFELQLKALSSADESERNAALEGFRNAGDRALPFLVGVVFSDDREQRLRGLTALRASVQEILKSSNQRRIAPLLERRRCRLLLAEMTRLDPDERALVTDVLNVSGLLPESFFADVLKKWPALDAAGRKTLLAERVESLELSEKVRGGAEPEVEKVRRLHDKTGEIR